MSFDITEHILPINEKFSEEILTPAANRFLSTKKYPMDSLPVFSGAGVYAIYIDSGADTIYNGVLDDDYPIYVGKAVPSGSRQGRSTISDRQLRKRLQEHKKSMEHGSLPVEYFTCRFMVMTGIGEDLIPALESTLIRIFHPLWNSYIDGFGIHTPGKGRFNQQPSEWDTLHPGRPWLSKLTGAPRNRNQIAAKIRSYKMRKV